MAMTEPIVVGVDGSGRSLRALDWAARSAVVHHSPLKIVHVLPRWVEDIPFFPPGRFEEAAKRGRRIVDEATERALRHHPDLDVDPAFPYGTAPAKALLDQAEHAKALVLGAKGMGLGNLALGSVSFQVAGHAACPVIVVNDLVEGNDEIAVGTDLSAHAHSALGYAFQSASLLGARLRVIYVSVMPYPPKPPLLDEPDPKELSEEHRLAVEEQISELRKQYPEVEVILDLPLRTTPREALTRATDRADLLVLGTRGGGGFHGLAMGSVTHHLLHQSACPLAIVRPEPNRPEAPRYPADESSPQE
jgi:nucleotide-binding universal stress UspA family protein